MSRGVNKVILIGTLGNDPDIKVLDGGSTVVNFSIATSESWKDKNTGEQKEQTEWHNIVGFGRAAEVIGEHMKKGSQIYVEGKLKTEKWTDENNVEKRATKIMMSSFSFIGNANNQAGGQNTNSSPAPQSKSPAPAPQKAPQAQNKAPAPAPEPADDFDDDIPF